MLKVNLRVGRSQGEHGIFILTYGMNLKVAAAIKIKKWKLMTLSLF